MRAADFFESLLDLDAKVVAIDTPASDECIDQFRELGWRTGKAVYHWDGDGGIRSLKTSEFAVPGSRILADALRYVLHSMHYGVYVFSDFRLQIDQPCVTLLCQIARVRSGYDRKVILVGNNIAYAPLLKKNIAQLQYRPMARIQPRLRANKWVMS